MIKALVWLAIGLYGSRYLGEYWHTWRDHHAGE